MEPAWSRKEIQGGTPSNSTELNTPLRDEAIVELRANRDIRDHGPRSSEKINNLGSRPPGRDPPNEKLTTPATMATKKKPTYTDADIPQLREQWFKEYSDLLGPIPLVLPPWREINHHIPLMDDNI